VADFAFKQRLFVGLGNPGTNYALTRHNMGYLVVQAYAELQGWRLKEEKSFQGMVVKGQVEDVMVHLLLPTTYMNESGQATRKYLDFFKITPSQIVVICDDVAIEFGEMRLRASGSNGGHNGLKSVEAHIGTRDYARLRMGIGQKHPLQNLADYVLDRFTKDELQKLPDMMQQGVEVVKRLLKEDITSVMHAVNTKNRKLSRPQAEGQENKI
jgi:peptidyl-tRNA hydrolase, PTH1 family